MSTSIEEISNFVGCDPHVREVGNGNDDEGDDSGVPRKADGKKVRSSGFGKDIGKAKQVVLRHFSKAKRLQLHRKSKRALRSSSGYCSADATRNSGKTILHGGTVGSSCYFCFSRPEVLESPSRSLTDDPEDPNFTFAMLKSLIEENNFYSKECNPHVD